MHIQYVYDNQIILISFLMNSCFYHLMPLNIIAATCCKMTSATKALQPLRAIYDIWTRHKSLRVWQRLGLADARQPILRWERSLLPSPRAIFSFYKTNLFSVVSEIYSLALFIPNPTETFACYENLGWYHRLLYYYDSVETAGRATANS